MAPKRFFKNKLTRSGYRRVQKLRNNFFCSLPQSDFVNNSTNANLSPDNNEIDNNKLTSHNLLDLNNSNIRENMFDSTVLVKTHNNQTITEHIEVSNGSGSHVPFNTIQNKSNEITFKQNLAKWSVEENIPHTSLSKLLVILNDTNQFKNLPKDARTLLKTTKHNFFVKNIAGGLFVYFGIKFSIDNLIKQYVCNLSSNETILLEINVDGLPLSKSTNSSFWPILGQIKNVCKVFIIGLFHGTTKPELNSFLSDFVKECVTLCNNGIEINKCGTKTFRLNTIICDTPAKSFLLNIKGHAGSFSCTKCQIEGDHIDRVQCFLELNCTKRTDKDFRDRNQLEHHLTVQKTPLEEVPYFNMIDGFPLDYMHLVCLGVVKRLLCSKKHGWIHGKPPYKLRASAVMEINKQLRLIRKFVPCEFSRKTRPVNEVKRYKATEFRFFLLYSGPVLLKDILPSKIYNHFLILFIAITLLIDSEFSQKKSVLDYAEKLLFKFVQDSISIYGGSFVSYNVHNLLHLVDCVRIHKNLDHFSAFPYENFMQILKNKIRKGDKPLEQVIRRVSEEQNLQYLNNSVKAENNFEFKIEHHDGPLLHLCTSPQYKKLCLPHFTINTRTESDKFVLLKNGKIIEVINFAQRSNSMIVIGCEYQIKAEFFKKPLISSTLSIWIIEKRTFPLNIYNINDISRKVVMLPYKENFVCVPLLH